MEFLIPWEPSIVALAALLALALLYLRGAAGIPAWRRFCFWTGFAVLYVGLQTDFDYYAEHAFFIHRLQHILLHHDAPFLIMLSAPGEALLAGLPSALRPRAERALRSNLARAFMSFINNPYAAVTLFTGLILFWLIPPVHFVAMLDGRLYRLMNWSMALNGFMFWGAMLNRHSPLSAWRRVAVLLAVAPPQIAIGAVLAFSSRDFYPIYTICGRIFALNPLQDQQMGGLILWIPGVMMSVIGALILFSRELAPRKTNFLNMVKDSSVSS